MPVTNAPTAGAAETMAVWDVARAVHRRLVVHEIGPLLAGAPDIDVLDGWTRTVCAIVDDVHRELVGKPNRADPSWRLAADAVVVVLEEQASIPWHVPQGTRTTWRKAVTERALALASIPARITFDHRTTNGSSK